MINALFNICVEQIIHFIDGADDDVEQIEQQIYSRM
jgi:hypothetical protein